MKATLAKFVSNVKVFLYDMSSQYCIIIDLGDQRESCVRHIFMALLSGPKSTLNSFIERNNYNWDTVREVPSVELIQNATKKCNNMVAAK